MKKYVFILNVVILSVFSQGQVGIGTDSPDNSAILDLDVSLLDTNNKKGFLGPRVALENETDQTTIPSPAIGLLVYNLGTAGLKLEGYLFWDGERWLRFVSGSTESPSITSLDCTLARMSPALFAQGVPYEGVMTIPYTGGNGGYYQTGSPIASTGVTGLTATLQSGNLAHGNGELVYSVSGIPSASSPEEAIFDIDFAGQNCTAVISNEAIGIGEMITGIFTLNYTQASTNNLILSDVYPGQMPVLDGLRMDLAVANTDLTFYRPRIYNVSPNNQLVSYQTFATQVNENKTALNINMTPNSFQGVDNNDVVYWTTTNAEVITTNLQVQINPTTYRWYEFTWWCMQIGTGPTSSKKIFMSVVRKA